MRYEKLSLKKSDQMNLENKKISLSMGDAALDGM